MTDGENSNSMQRMAENMSEEHQAYTICFMCFQKDSMTPGCSVATSLLVVIH